jgi:ribosomal protein S18 acetylase RimI-like enzyme
VTTGHDSVGGSPARRRHEPPIWEFGDLIIRRYVAGDHDHVLALHRTALAEVGLRPGDGVYYDHDFPRLEEIYLGGDGEFVVAEPVPMPAPMPTPMPTPMPAAALVPAPAPAAGTGGRVIGMGGLRRVDAETAEMVRLRVHPTVQRRGYGGAIVRVLEERAVELGYRQLRCDTTARQEPALRLYHGFGWRETRREEIRGVVTIYLEKALTPPDDLSRRPPRA